VNNIHVCASESLLAGSIDFVGYCPICCTEEYVQRTGYVGGYCMGCDSHYSFEDMAGVVRQRRKILGLERRDMAALFAVSPQTISNYENVWPSKKYWQFTKELVLKSSS
jgi:hypothetical protein